jgi:hypothetical protein
MGKKEYHAAYRAKNKYKLAKNQAKYYAKNKDKIAKNMAEYYDKNKDKLAEYYAEYRANNKEKIAEYRAKNKDKIAEYYAEYRAKNKDKIAEYHKTHYIPVGTGGSRGELELFAILDNLKQTGVIDCWHKQHTHPKIINKNVLPFDAAFFIDDNPYFIEYQGQHHYMPICFGGISMDRAEKEFFKTQDRDRIKRQRCFELKIPLLRIRYDQDIEQILIAFLEIEGIL